jgi:hypothetical protein
LFGDNIILAYRHLSKKKTLTAFSIGIKLTTYLCRNYIVMICGQRAAKPEARKPRFDILKPPAVPAERLGSGWLRKTGVFAHAVVHLVSGYLPPYSQPVPAH